MDNLDDLLLQQSKPGAPLIGCFPLYPPLELLHAMNLQPVVLWGLRGSLPAVPLSDRHIQPYTCSVARHLAEFVLSDRGARLAALCMYNACDTLRNLPEILVDGRALPVFRLHVPQIGAERSDAEPYLRERIAGLVGELERAFGTRFSTEKFRESVVLYRRARELSARLEELVRRGSLSYGLFSSLLQAGSFLPIGEQVRRLGDAIAAHEAVAPDTGAAIPVLVSGILPPPPGLIDAIERAGLRVVANDVACQRRSYDRTPDRDDDPAAYYADFYHHHFPCTTLLYTAQRRLDELGYMAARTGARGCIFIGEKFCEYEYFELPHLEKYMKARGVSTLALEIAIDDENGGSYRTRVEAFAELLGKATA